MYRITNAFYRSHPMTLHECLLHINVFMDGLVHWQHRSRGAAEAVEAGYKIERVK